MAKKQKTKKKGKKLQGINGWLAIVLAIFILSAINSIILLNQKISVLVYLSFRIGVLISAVLLFVYCFFILFSIFLMLKKKKIAVKISITTLIIGIIFLIWYDIVGMIIFYGKLILADLINFLINLVIMIVVILYLKKSKRVKNTLVK